VHGEHQRNVKQGLLAVTEPGEINDILAMAWCEPDAQMPQKILYLVSPE